MATKKLQQALGRQKTLDQINNDPDGDIKALATVKDVAILGDKMKATYEAALADKGRLAHALMLGAMWRYGDAVNLLGNQKDQKALATKIGYSVVHLRTCGRLYDGKPIMFEAAAWYQTHKDNLVRKEKYTVDGQDKEKEIGFRPRKADGIEWQIAVNDAYSEFLDVKKRKNLTDDKAVDFLRDEVYTVEIDLRTKDQKNSQLKNKLIEDAAKFGLKLADPTEDKAKIDIKQVYFPKAEQAPATVKIPGKDQPKPSAQA